MAEASELAASSDAGHLAARERVRIADLERTLLSRSDRTLAPVTKRVLDAILLAEFSEHLGYDPKERLGNGVRPDVRHEILRREIFTDEGPIELEVPCDHNGSFEPKLVEKEQRQLSGTRQMVISFAAKGLSTRQLHAELVRVYADAVSKQAAWRIARRVIGEMAEWQHRPLDPSYPMVLIHAEARTSGFEAAASRPLLTAIGLKPDGSPEILGLWFASGREAARFWLDGLKHIKRRGVEGVGTVACDGLEGLPAAIREVWPAALVTSNGQAANVPPVSMKQVYEHPTIASLARTLEVATPMSATERALSEVLRGVLRVEEVPAHGHFFDELGADSMVLARFCARLRKQTDLPPVSMKQVYEHPTIASLARTLEPGGASTEQVADGEAIEALPVEPSRPVGPLGHILCGVLQLLTMVGYLSLFTVALASGASWIASGERLGQQLVRLVVLSNAIVLGLAILPVLLKWIVIGRWKREQIRVWSLRYYRFWVVKTLVTVNPLALLAGTPTYVLYLRALGAKIGRNVVILSRRVPVCTDLLSIGDDTVVRKDSFLNCYRAHDGMVETGSITLGRGVVVGELTVLDIETEMGDGAQLAHSSTLVAGEVVPAGERRCGSPARHRTTVDYRNVEPAVSGTARKIGFTLLQLLNWLVISAVASAVALALAGTIANRPYFASPESDAWAEGSLYRDALLFAALLLVGGILVRLLVVATVPRLLNLAIEPERTYPLYGMRYFLHRGIVRLTNVSFFTHLFGDSSYIVPYLRWVGYDLSENVLQTGSNFGSAVKHDNPYLVSVGRGTMVADGLSLINADYSNTSFRLARVSVGADNFLGNQVAYPALGKTGENCLLATKVMVPLDGEVRTGTGLLGAPCFEIPRSVLRDAGLVRGRSEMELDERLARKNRHNLVTLTLFLLGEWFFLFGIVSMGLLATAFSQTAGSFVLAVALVLALVVRVSYQLLLERAATRFRPLEPQECSIYEPYFWFHERYWKLAVRPIHLALFAGTPLKTAFWRLSGVHIGKRVFDDGCVITERTLVAIGDGCTLNAGSVVQSHSQEDGGFKSDRITIGAGCTVGTGALVHYGAAMGDNARLAPGAFLMKGQEVPENSQWEGNPAEEVQGSVPVRPSASDTQRPPPLGQTNGNGSLIEQLA